MSKCSKHSGDMREKVGAVFSLAKDTDISAVIYSYHKQLIISDEGTGLSEHAAPGEQPLKICRMTGAAQFVV